MRGLTLEMESLGMASLPLRYHHIESLEDEFLLPWLDLYETAFPPEEKLLVSTFLQILKDKSEGYEKNHSLLAALNMADEFMGMALVDDLEEYRLFFLEYFAVSPERRGMGAGTEFYREILRRFELSGAKALIIEVEIPEISPDPDMAEARIRFYQRNGAKLFRGIDYTLEIGPHQPPIPMHLMIQARQGEELTAQQAFELAKAFFEESLVQIGELSL